MTTLSAKTGCGPASTATNVFYGVLRTLVGLLLLTAAGLKGYQLATYPTPDTSLLNTRWFLIITVEYELILGAWLISGWHQRKAWLAALVSFTVFTCITVYKAVSGEASCGCFGRFEINPWFTLILDLLIVAALIACRPKPANTRTGTPPQTTRAFSTLALVTVLGGPAGYLMAGYTPADLDDEGQVFGDSAFVVLEPKTWVGKQFPLLGYIDIGDQLADGQWIVVLYRHDCPHCMEELPKYERLARDYADRSDSPGVALIEIAPYAQSGSGSVSDNTYCTRGRLSSGNDWFVQTPLELRLDTGVVISKSIKK